MRTGTVGMVMAEKEMVETSLQVQEPKHDLGRPRKQVASGRWFHGSWPETGEERKTGEMTRN